MPEEESNKERPEEAVGKDGEPAGSGVTPSGDDAREGAGGKATKEARESTRKGNVDQQVIMRSLGARVERLYTHPLSRVLDRARSMDIEEWSRSREDIVRILEAGSSALLGLLEDVEQYLTCVTVREWDDPEPNDLGELAGGIVADILKRREYEGVVIMAKLSDLPPVQGYRRMVKAALEEVIENAVIASAGGEKRVEITGVKSDGFVRVEVKDMGPGVDEEEREYMYLPFHTGREGRSGLGLPMVQRVMHRLGGGVGLEDSPTGAVFFLEFPLAEGREESGGENPG